MSFSPITASQGADGYIAFFTNSSGLAGDNDLYWDRANNQLRIDGYIIPNTDDYHSLGTATNRWKDLWLGPGSLHIKTTTQQTGEAKDWVIGTDSTGTLRIRNGDDPASFAISSDNRFKINTAVSSGYLNVGTDNGLVQIANTFPAIVTGTNNGGSIYLGPDASAAGNPTGAIETSWGGAGVPQIGIGVIRDTLKANILMTYNNETYLRNGTSTSIMINSSGQVGIGGISPGLALEVNGTIRTRSPNDNPYGFVATPDGSTEKANLFVSGGNVNHGGYLRLTNGDGDTTISTIVMRNAALTTINLITNSGNSYFNGGNVGIGTNAPQNKLDVEGAVAIGASYSGTETAPSNGLIVQGNVGIGIASPYSKLDVNGEVVKIGTGSGSNLALRPRDGSPADDSSAFIISVRGDVGGANEDLKILRYVSDSFQGIPLQIQNSSGFVNITPSGSSPLTRLQVDHDGASTYGYALRVFQHQIGNGDGPKIEFYKTMTSSKSWGLGILNGTNVDDFVIAEDGNAAGGFGTPRLVILAGGNVGLGTDNPTADLHVYAGAADATILLESTTANNYDQSLIFKDPNISWYVGQKFNIAEAFGIGRSNAKDDFIIDANGRVGINTNSPQAQFHVAGDGYYDGYLMPWTDDTWGLGTPDKRWRDLYLGPGSIHLRSLAAQTDIGGIRDWVIGLNNSGNLKFKQADDSTALIISENGSLGINIGNDAIPSAKLSISTTGSEVGGTVTSTTLLTQSGSLGTTAGNQLRLASFGFTSGNASTLAIRAYRIANGSDWTTASIGLGMNVDATEPVNNSVVWIAANGGFGIGVVNPQNKLDVEGAAVIGASYSGTETAPSNGLLVEGNVGIGTPSPAAKLHLQSNTDTQAIIRSYVSAANQFSYLFLDHPRGTAASPSANLNGDEIYRIYGRGYNNGDIRDVSIIKSLVDGAPGATFLPGRLEFQTGSDSAGPTTKLSISASGLVTIANNLTVTGDLTVDSDTLYVDSADNRVGVLTTDPLQAFDVRGAIAIVGTGSYSELAIRERGGTVRSTGAWNLSVRGDVGNNNDNLKFLRFNGASFIDIPFKISNSTGYVGVALGNTTEPSYPLDVLGVSAATSFKPKGGTGDVAFLNSSTLEIGSNHETESGALIDLHASATNTDYATRIYRHAGTDADFDIVNTGTGVFTISQANAGALQLVTNNANRLYITSAGFVAIGGTNIPSSKLEVLHDGASTFGYAIRIYQNAIGNSDGPKIEFFKTMTSNKYWGAGIANGVNVSRFGIFEDGSAAGGFGTERLTILAGGNVGIGVVNPQNKLDVEGAAVIGASYSGTETAPSNGLLVEGNVGISNISPAVALHVGSGSYAGSSLPGIRITNASNQSYLSASDATRTIFMGADTSSYGIIGMLTNHNLGFRTNNTLYMTLTNAGNLQLASTTFSQEFSGVVTYNSGSYLFSSYARLYFPGNSFNGNGSMYATAGSIQIKAQTLEWDSGNILVPGAEIFLEGGKSPNAGQVPGSIVLKTNNTERVRVSAAGYVGIGLATSVEADTRLRVEGSHISGRGILFVRGSDHGYVYVDTNSSSGESGYGWKREDAQKWLAYVPGGSDSLIFNDGSNRVTFKNGGNVGIGTTDPTPHFTPSTALVVSGGSNRSIIELWGQSSGKSIIQSVSGNTYFGSLAKGSGSGDVYISYGDGTTGVYLLGASGNLGIGSSPVNKLDVEGAVAIGASYSGTETAPSNGLLVEGNVGIGIASPTSRLHTNYPSTINPSLTWGALSAAIIRDENVELAMALSATSPYPWWIQARTVSSTANDIALQPKGGNLQFGEIEVNKTSGITTRSFYVPEKTVTLGSVSSTTAYGEHLYLQAAGVSGAIWGSGSGITAGNILIKAGDANETGNNGTAVATYKGGDVTITAGYAKQGDTVASNPTLTQGKIYFQTATNATAVDSTYTTRMTVAGSSVGIGTTSPNAKLHLYSSSSDTKLIIESGTANNYDQSIIFKDTSNEWHVGQDYNSPSTGFGIGTSGSKDYFKIDSSGNVGIGGAATSKLYVAGTTHIVGNSVANSQGTHFVWNTSGGGGETDFVNHHGVGSGGFRFYDTGNATVGTLLMTLTGGGNLGIGSSPVNKLDVEGAAVIGAGYSGTNTAPTNGLLVEGFVGIGNTNTINAKISLGSDVTARKLLVYNNSADTIATGLGSPASTDLSVFCDEQGLVSIGCWNSTLSSYMPGIEVQPLSSGTNFITNFKNDSLAHGMTSIASTDTQGAIREVGSNNGGMHIYGLSTGSALGVKLTGYSDTANTSTSTSSTAPIYLDSGFKSGTSATSYGATDNIFAIANNNAVQAMLKGDGTLWVNTSGTGTAAQVNLYDDEKDALACRDAAYILSANPSKVLEYNKDELIRLNVMSEGGFLNMQNATGLMLGGISEVYQVLELLLDKLGLDYETLRQEIRNKK